MQLRRLSLLLAATSIAAAPALAAPAAPAASLSVSKAARAATPTTCTGKLPGGGTCALIGFLVFIAAVVVIHEVAEDKSDSN